MARQALPKLNVHFHRVASNIRQQCALTHQAQPLQTAPHQQHPHLNGLAQNHHKTQAQPQKKPHHVYADLKPLSLGQIQSSWINNTYNICINQAMINVTAVNENAWRKTA
jgi:hypothetical protein